MKLSSSLFLCSFLFLTLTVNAQSIQGEWKINHLIIDSLVQDYTLDTLTTKRFSNYGNHISINKNGRFRTWYTAPCGNDCFISSYGRYIQVDSTKIQFIIENVDFIKAECNGRTSPYKFPLNSGLFYIYKVNNQIHFVKKME